MKTIVFIVCFFAIVSALQETSTNQGSFTTESLPKEITQNKLFKSILKLAQLGTRAQQVDFSRLFLAIDDLAESLKERKTEENALFDQDYNQYIADHDFYQVQVTQYTQETATHQNALDDLTEERVRLERSLGVKKQELFMANLNSKNLKNAMTKSDRSFQGKLKDFDKAFDVIDRATKQLETARGSSFAETDHEEIANIGTFLQKNLETISYQHVLMTPLIEAMIQLGQGKFDDQQAIKQVVQLLQNLRAEIMDNKNVLIGTHANEQEENQKMLDTYAEQVANLSDEVIPGLQSDIQTKDGQIEIKAALLKDSTDNLNQSQGNFDATESRWTSRQAQHKLLEDEFDNELLILGQTTAALEKGGIRRQ